MCGSVVIDDNGRDRIAAFAATNGRVTTSPFGPDDQIGMLNLLNPDSARTYLARADAGRVMDLSVDLFLDMPTWTAGGEPPYNIWMVHTPDGSVVDDPVGVGSDQNRHVAWSADAISMFTHCGTHIDTLNHFGYRGRIWNGYSAAEHLGSRHWTVAGADRLPPMIGRGVLIDVPAALGVDVLPDSFPIGEKEIRDALHRQQTELSTGDIVFVRTGRMRYWPDPQMYLPREPGLNREGARYLAESGAALIGSDNIAVEQLPADDPENWMTVHTFLLAEAGIPMAEVVNLEELSSEAIFEFVYVGASLKLRGATAGPIRPLAMPML